MNRAVQTILDAFYATRVWFVRLMTYGLLRLYGLEVTWEHVVQGRYGWREHESLDLSRASDLGSILAVARDRLHGAQERRATVADKCKTLLTVSSLLLAVISLLLPTAMAFESLWMRVVFFTGLAALTGVVVGLLVFLDVGTDMEVSLDQQEVELSSEDLQRNLIDSYGHCWVNAENRTDFLVDTYRVSRFCFLVSLSVIILLFSVSYWSTDSGEPERAVIRALRSDPELVELLRGPAGDRGPAGERGPEGQPGRVGERGAKGGRRHSRALGRPSDGPTP